MIVAMLVVGLVAGLWIALEIICKRVWLRLFLMTPVWIFIFAAILGTQYTLKLERAYYRDAVFAEYRLLKANQTDAVKDALAEYQRILEDGRPNEAAGALFHNLQQANTTTPEQPASEYRR